MRGQEPGSEHERRDADGAPATPPPSFGQHRDDGDIFADAPPVLYGEAPPAYPFTPADALSEPPSGSSDGTASAGPEGVARSGFDRAEPAGPESAAPGSFGGAAPEPAPSTRPFPPQPGGRHGNPPIPVYPGPPPNLPEARPAVDVPPWDHQLPTRQEDPDGGGRGMASGTPPWENPLPAAPPWGTPEPGDLPALPAFPAAQPWEVPGDDAYDWFAHTESADQAAATPGAPGVPGLGTPAPGAPLSISTPGPATGSHAPGGPGPITGPQPAGPSPSPTPPALGAPGGPAVPDAGVPGTVVPEARGADGAQRAEAPVVPGAPPWEPPPAFTAAAAGMHVWPSPVPDHPATPPWPAATGEPIPDADFDPPQASPDETQDFRPRPQPQSGPQRPMDANPAPQVSGQSPQSPAPGGPAGSSAPDQPALGTPQQATHAQGTPGGPTTPRTGPTAPAGDPNVTTPVTRPAEPGDIPVWPPKSPEDLDDTGPQPRIPDLPFSPEIWGPRNQTDRPTPPQGLPAHPPIPAQAAPPNGAPVQIPAQPSPHTGNLFIPHQEQPQLLPPPQPPKKSGSAKKAILITTGVLVLAGVATGGFFAYRALDTRKPTIPAVAAKPTSTPTMTEPATTPPVTTSVLNSEQTDPKTLSLTEAFPAKKVKIGGSTFTRVKVNMAADCDKAASGPFADALKSQQCSRVLRATYVDSKRRYAVTTGFAVLPTKDAAVKADGAKNLGNNLWFRALPGASGSGGDRVHIAGGYAAGLVWGRYIVFSYATYADGHTPTAKETGLSKISGAFRDETSEVLERRIADS
ncbi:hypothetical protein OIE66_35955 [Nonomuraea sp. NBC_01738]|uniref:hypothetical protein n=1 Tax=Nonomuraea sp. NBC_01738 TaxID=2976003 RepID=UPI002E0DDA47|nr:hypothetical protein OIE66_35955 [Nonomuraea sp. NBC_01738]